MSMSMSVVMTRVRNAVGGYNENMLEILDDLALYHYADQAVLEIKRELRRPIRERDFPMTVGVRGIQMDDDFMDLVDEHSVRLIESGSDSTSEGIVFPILSDQDLFL